MKVDKNYIDKKKSIILKSLSEISDKNESNLKIVLKKTEKKKIIQSNFEIYKRDKNFKKKFQL